MKNRFNLSNLPLVFFDDFFNIETDEVKEALIDIANVMYDDYTVEEVQQMFSTFATTSYEVYQLHLCCNADADSDYKQTLDMLVEVLLYCASQLLTYEVHDPFKLLPHRG